MNSIEIAYPTTGKFRKLYMYWEKGYCERKIPLSHQGSPHVMIIANSWTLLTSWVVLDATIKGASRSYNIKWPSHFISCDFLLSELNCSFRLATLADFTVQQIWILAWCVKRQNIAGLCQQTFLFCSADGFFDHVLLLAELAQKFKFFKIAVWWSDSMKWNFGRCIFKFRIKTIFSIFLLYLLKKINMIFIPP